jgi:hypothetical protein
MRRVETQSIREVATGSIARLSPPGDFVSEAVVVAVMASAQRHRELIAHLASNRAELGESQVVGVSSRSVWRGGTATHTQ